MTYIDSNLSLSDRLYLYKQLKNIDSEYKDIIQKASVALAPSTYDLQINLDKSKEELLIDLSMMEEILSYVKKDIPIDHKVKTKLESNIKNIKNRIKELDMEVEEPEITIDPEILKNALEILEYGDPMNFLIGEHQKMHIGDIVGAKKIILAVCNQSINTSDGLQPKVSGGYSKGKTHNCNSVFHLCPQEYVITSGFSDKALYYSKLKPGMIISMDDVKLSEDLQTTIKKATTNFQVGTNHTTVDKGISYTKKIPSRTMFCLTSVDNDQSMELLSRTIDIDVDDSPEQDKKVAEFELRRIKEGIPRFPIDKNTLICRQILREIKTREFNVIIPFDIDISFIDISDRRNLPMFNDLIKGFTVLNFMQRTKDISGRLVADIKDYESAKELYNINKRSQESKLTKIEQNIIDILLKEPAGLTSKELQTKAEISKGRLSQIMNGIPYRHTIGLLDKYKDLYSQEILEKDDDITTRYKRYWIEKDGWER